MPSGRARIQAATWLWDLLVRICDQLAPLPTEQQDARWRPGKLTDPAEAAKAALAAAARRHQTLTAEIALLDSAREELVAQASPSGCWHR